jgi:uncharacterized protein (DUF3084 family)
MESTTVGTSPPAIHDQLHMQAATHENALKVLAAERARLSKQLDVLKAERQVLEAVARRLASTGRSSDAAGH